MLLPIKPSARPAIAIATAAAALLALAGSASGAAIPLKGPKTIRGAGYVSITLRGTSQGRLVLTSTGTKRLRVSDQNGNLNVRCTGGAKRKQSSASLGGAKKVVECVGLSAGATASGSRFTATLDAKSYLARVPRGYSGSYDLTAPQRANSQKFLDCMKERGVDVDDVSQLDRNDPAVQAALQACRQYLPARP
jgi:hypothetical protein